MFDPNIQTEPNGYWTPDFRYRVTILKETAGLTYADLGRAMGFSGQFVHNLLHGKETHRMHSKHTEKILKAVEDLEIQAGLKEPNEIEPTEEDDDLATLIRKINKLGFSVELKPLP